MESMSKGRSFKRELTQLLNRYNVENHSNTPDYLLAGYLLQCLQVFEWTIKSREEWHGRPVDAGNPWTDRTDDGEPTPTTRLI